ncbi:MAG: hypothetical protein NC924_02685 [Candidatus Omnitrophica bacterium]|nr:hypothetical protein [Candidatus Omnitrophota bacterium]
MRKGLSLAIIAMVMAYAAAAMAQSADDQLAGKAVAFDESGYFYVYKDARNRSNHYIPSGWMGDYGDLKIKDSFKDNPQSGTTCIEWTYSAEGKQGANWAGVFWQNPANNWGDKNGGFDLRGAKKLTFWARGAKGDERLLEVKVGGITGNYSDSDSVGIGPIDLTTDWKQYEIDLSQADLSYIIGGFCWATNADSNPDGMVFYLDEIRFEK